MTRNEWSLLDMFMRWIREDMAKIGGQVDNLEELIKKLEPKDGKSERSESNRY